MKPIITLSGLHAGYPRHPVLRAMDLSVNPGDNVGIIGPNGGGKSTLLRVISGLLVPQAGIALINGQAPWKVPPKERARWLAAMATDPGRPGYITVQEFVLLGRMPWLGWLGCYSTQDRHIARAAMDVCGVSDQSHLPLAALSSGQFQLAALARTVAQIWNVPQGILLLDELTANLDLARKLAICALLDCWRAQGYTIVQAAHDCNLAALFCTHLLGLKGGKTMFFGPVKEVFTRENLSDLYGCALDIQYHPDTGLPQIYPHLPVVGQAGHSGPSGTHL